MALRYADGASQRNWAPTAISSLHPRRWTSAIGEWSRRKTRWKSGSQFHITVRYMISSPFVEFPEPARVTPGEAKRGARLPSAEALHLRRVRRNLFAALREQDLSGYRNPKGGRAEA